MIDEKLAMKVKKVLNINYQPVSLTGDEKKQIAQIVNEKLDEAKKAEDRIEKITAFNSYLTWLNLFHDRAIKPYELDAVSTTLFEEFLEEF